MLLSSVGDLKLNFTLILHTSVRWCIFFSSLRLGLISDAHNYDYAV